MFTFGNKYKDEINTLTDRIRALELQLTTLVSEQMQTKDTSADSIKCSSDALKLKEDVRDSSFSFDFDGINAFSIERIEMDGKIQTIIGFWVETEHGKCVDQSWFMECNHETHERLVQEFNNHKAEKRAAQKNTQTIMST